MEGPTLPERVDEPDDPAERVFSTPLLAPRESPCDRNGVASNSMGVPAVSRTPVGSDRSVRSVAPFLTPREESVRSKYGCCCCDDGGRGGEEKVVVLEKVAFPAFPPFSFPPGVCGVCGVCGCVLCVEPCTVCSAWAGWAAWAA